MDASLSMGVDDSAIRVEVLEELNKKVDHPKLPALDLDQLETNKVKRIHGNENLVFSTVTPKDRNVLLSMSIDELRKMVFFL